MNLNNNYIGYFMDRFNEIEVYFVSRTKERLPIVIETTSTGFNLIKGELILLYLNASFSNIKDAEETFYNKLPINTRNMVENFSTLKDLQEFQILFQNSAENLPKKGPVKKSWDTHLPNKKIIEYFEKTNKEEISVILDDYISNDEKRKIKELSHIFSLQDVFFVKSIPQLLYVMLRKYYMRSEIQIKKCKNCGRYFIPTRRSDELYCDELYKDTNKTCKELGATIIYQQKLNDEPLLYQYINLVKRKNMRAKRSKEENALKDFETWKIKARVEMEKFKNGEITSDEFKSWLENNE